MNNGVSKCEPTTEAVGDGQATASARPWLNAWFPVLFERDLAPDGLTRVTVYGEGFVLFRGKGGGVECLPDRCPHRAARLSDGRLENGEVMCLYHGWRFREGGDCVHIPQLEEGKSVPEGAHLAPVQVRVVDDLVWIFAGSEAERSQQVEPAPNPELTAPGVHVIDFATDLPYGHAALIENVLDFAHIHIAHDGVRGGGHRDHAGPLSFDVTDEGESGFTARFLSKSKEPGGASAQVRFAAPYLVHYETTFPEAGRVSGLALYALPIGGGRCRLLYRAYGTDFPKADRQRARWREHLHQLRLLEQDMSVVLGQTDELRRAPGTLRDSWLPIKSSDPLVIRYAKWLDEYARDLPGTIGWAHRQGAGSQVPLAPPALDRWTLHTASCLDCRAAKERLDQNATLAWGAAGFCVLLTALLTWPWSLLPAIAAGVSAAVALKHRASSRELVADRMTAGSQD